jgi:ferredoxin
VTALSKLSFSLFFILWIFIEVLAKGIFVGSRTKKNHGLLGSTGEAMLSGRSVLRFQATSPGYALRLKAAAHLPRSVAPQSPLPRLAPLPFKFGSCHHRLPHGRYHVARRLRSTGGGSKEAITLTLTMPDDTQLVIEASRNDTLLEAVLKSDVSDAWEGGACGGACNCSTCCLVPVGTSTVEALDESVPKEEDEEDMLDCAKGQAEQRGEETEYFDKARLSCQIDLSDVKAESLQLRVPETTFNMLEIPLWMRNR